VNDASCVVRRAALSCFDVFEMHHDAMAADSALHCTLSFQLNVGILCNRALAHIKQENYGLAIMDAQTCIATDSTFAKGFYRKGTVKNLALHYRDLIRRCIFELRIPKQSPIARWLLLNPCDVRVTRVAGEVKRMDALCLCCFQLSSPKF
jgi:hypothetical protein